MQFYSTSHHSPKASLHEAVMTGLAPDGGLYLPERIPLIPGAFFNNIADMSIRDISYVVADLILGDDIPSAEIKNIVMDTFTFDVPLLKLGRDRFVLELFHGPTMAFKDVGARFLARVISHYSQASGRDVKVLVATSGDSGGAVANGFLGVKGVQVYVLYPHDGLTALQKSQFNIPGSNIRPIEVHGTFDDCQRLAKKAFADPELRENCQLTSANSINICRLLPQMFYFFHAYASVMHREGAGEGVVIAVPSGNLGNLTAGLLAMKMGLPVKRFVVANNANSVTVDYLSDGVFNPRRAVRTIACSMDVGNPSNIDRIREIFGGDHEAMRKAMHGYTVTDEQIKAVMSTCYSARSYLLDPHGATALLALDRDLQPGEKGIFLETAHPSKFPKAVLDTTGVRFNPLPQHIASRPPLHRISASEDALKKILLAG